MRKQNPTKQTGFTLIFAKHKYFEIFFQNIFHTLASFSNDDSQLCISSSLNSD